ncbi:hypothetical protein [Paracoccus aestuariivivens]|uniref:RcnB family protein n=1 Tax=Paracoccus aestuariivivens TaxID=1820333 RepID=A0A6L6J6T5_9RHOB|nr:hypothetical protein [Paracoccus aestuariivivens]MTH77296.1 hypothetical protein [Paracoccus aestuariivivens]
MTAHIRKYLIAAAMAVAACTMALAQHSQNNDVQGTNAQTAALSAPKALRVGQQIEPAHLHRINRPGLYGISQAPNGSGYGVIDGRLIRYDAQTMRVQSIIRQIDNILD